MARPANGKKNGSGNEKMVAEMEKIVAEIEKMIAEMEKTWKNVIRKRHEKCSQHDAKMTPKWVPKSLPNRKIP